MAVVLTLKLESEVSRAGGGEGKTGVKQEGEKKKRQTNAGGLSETHKDKPEGPAARVSKPPTSGM